MSPSPDHPTELEERLTAALAARADLVRDEDLRDLLLPAPAVSPLRRRATYAVVAATAACLLVAATLALADRGPDRVEPAPAPDRPTVTVPADVGADWDRATASPPARLDLDGDGTDEVVRFLAEPSDDVSGRIRLQTTPSVAGEPAFGVLRLATSLAVPHLRDRVDLDDDGDQELVLYHEPEPGVRMLPVVVDLRDGALVEAPPLDPDLLARGEQEVSVAADGSYSMVRVLDYWVEGGRLFSMRSVNAFASASMSLWRPTRYVNDVWAWRLADDGVLEPVESAGRVCVDGLEDRREPCLVGEQDALPVVAPVSEERIGPGGSFSSDDGYRYTVALEVEAGREVVRVEGEDGRTILEQPTVGTEPRVYLQQPTAVFADGASLLLASDDGDEPVAHQLLVQREERLVRLEPDGAVPFGTGYTDDARPHRTWITAGGEVFTALADTGDPSGSWSLWSWTMTGAEQMSAVPRAEGVCFADATDPATARRC